MRRLTKPKRKCTRASMILFKALRDTIYTALEPFGREHGPVDGKSLEIWYKQEDMFDVADNIDRAKASLTDGALGVIDIFIESR